MNPINAPNCAFAPNQNIPLATTNREVSDEAAMVRYAFRLSMSDSLDQVPPPPVSTTTTTTTYTQQIIEYIDNDDDDETSRTQNDIETCKMMELIVDHTAVNQQITNHKMNIWIIIII
ncbi:unnamed protein product [Rotaria magnacalcarata]|uniref:Uncharacterized protein n=1 Tax=Rotaria magnacalcarata TaxID=392030 RepID=A0A816LSR3_9BILA|nr:unnamed protein product [Rotaria magnacalcarata]